MRLFAEHDPDIICLQEVTRRFATACRARAIATKCITPPVVRPLDLCRYIDLLVQAPLIRDNYVLSDVDGSTVGSCAYACYAQRVLRA